MWKTWGKRWVLRWDLNDVERQTVWTVNFQNAASGVAGFSLDKYHWASLENVEKWSKHSALWDSITNKHSRKINQQHAVKFVGCKTTLCCSWVHYLKPSKYLQPCHWNLLILNTDDQSWSPNDLLITEEQRLLLICGWINIKSSYKNYVVHQRMLRNILM